MADLEAADNVNEKTQLNESPKQENDCYTKEELLELSNTPCWNLTRRILLCLFWICWFGMIAWSICIVIYAPKCKKEPDQAWFTKGAIAQFDCSAPLEEITSQLQNIDAGQYKGIMAEGCSPALADFDATTTTDENAEKVTKMAELTLQKDIKLLISVDASNVPDFFEGDSWEAYSSNYIADGYIFKNAKNMTIGTDVETDEGTSLFFEGTLNIPSNAFYFKSMDGDNALEDSKKWLENTLSVNQTMENVDIEVWEVEEGKETLWKASKFLNGDKPSAEFIMSSVLPGGFIVPFEEKDEDKKVTPKFVKYGHEWRQEYQSLRAITGSIIRWFTRNEGFSRKFDLQPAIEVFANLNEEDFEISAVRGASITAKDPQTIYPEEKSPIVNPGDAQVRVV